MNSDSLSKEELGSYYTNSIISDYIAQKIWFYVKDGALDKTRDKLLMIDPAMGDGNLLYPFNKIVPEESQKMLEMHGFDIDINALNEAEQRFSNSSIPTKFNYLDSLTFIAEKNNKQYDLLVTNPPWGAIVNHSRDKLNELGYKTAVKQFDSYDLFVELSLKIVKKGGLLAFILPDSIFQEQHEIVRQELIDRTTILTIFRLGEGFFDSVYRSTVIFIVKNEKPQLGHETEVTVLRKSGRKNVLSFSETLEEYEHKNSVKVKQQRFKTSFYQFNVELTSEQDFEIIEKIKSSKQSIDDFFKVGRGIEISKNGKYYFCTHCQFSQKKGKELVENCPSCGNRLKLETVVFKDKIEDSQPMVAGEDFSRYSRPVPRYIMNNLNNLNYKTSILNQSNSKILVRKTGLGITATLDEEKLYTNQVVFSIIESSSVQYPLKVLLAILNSRVMLFYHLKNSGETEWKSHPYITQSTLKKFPLPALIDKSELVIAISKLVTKLFDEGYTRNLDIEIEKLVLNLFDLDFASLEYINSY